MKKLMYKYRIRRLGQGGRSWKIFDAETGKKVFQCKTKREAFELMRVLNTIIYFARECDKKDRELLEEITRIYEQQHMDPSPYGKKL